MTMLYDTYPTTVDRINSFVTVPMSDVHPLAPRFTDDELYFLFEQATEQRIVNADQQTSLSCNTARLKRIRLVCLVCLLPMIGFDFMGLLVLHAR